MVTREEFKENLLALLDIINNRQKKRGNKNDKKRHNHNVNYFICL